ncbi:MAG: hypothetical protein LPK01_03990, partial [Hymenobacteraceae bacterium]|nr:hypothetical protein [Hymenobacteraceae bacterium]
MQDTKSHKPKLDTRMDRLYYSYIDEEVDAGLSVADREYREQLEAAWSLLINYHSFEQALPLLMAREWGAERKKISRATAYRVLNNCTKLFGDVTQL